MAANIQPITFDSADVGYPALHWGFEGTTQSFKLGAPLINSGGYLIEATASNAGALSGVIGIAAAAASGTTHAAIPYYPMNASFYWAITVDGAESGGNAPGTGSLTQANMFTSYNIYKDGNSGYWFLEDSDTTHLNVVAIDLIDPASTVNGRVRVKFLSAVTLAG